MAQDDEGKIYVLSLPELGWSRVAASGWITDFALPHHVRIGKRWPSWTLTGTFRWDWRFFSDRENERSLHVDLDRRLATEIELPLFMDVYVRLDFGRHMSGANFIGLNVGWKPED